VSVGKVGFFLSMIIGAVCISLIANIHLHVINNQLNDELSESRQMEFKTVEKGCFSRHRSAAHYVIQNEDEWTNVWNHHDVSMPQRSPPEVNFSETTIIAVFMGEFNTGGYGIETNSILNMNHSVVVKIEKTYPGKGCGVTEAFTYPYHIVKTGKIDKEITFDTVEKTIECP
jgi:hypothetical protein